MQIFLSWSGERSKAVADVLAAWLSQVIQAADPWLSRDIAKGARWGPEVTARLEASRVGIVCLTPENIDSRWILYEAGALSKTKDAHVCTFLLGLRPADIAEPLSQFQHTSTEKSDVKLLVQTINQAVREAGEKALSDHVLDGVFETNWPGLAERLSAVLAWSSTPPPRRSERDLLEEVVEMLRRQELRLSRDHQKHAVGESRSLTDAALRQVILDKTLFTDLVKRISEAQDQELLGPADELDPTHMAGGPAITDRRPASE